MWQINGTINKMLGKQVYRADFLRPSGTGKYTWVKSLYFHAGEKFLTPNKEVSTELHLENICEYRRNIAVCKVNADTGQPITLDDGATVTYPPHVLHRMLSAEHLQKAVQATKRGDTNLIMCVLCFGIGAVLFFMIGNNWPAIVGTFQGTAANQTRAVARPIVEALINGVI